MKTGRATPCSAGRSGGDSPTRKELVSLRPLPVRLDKASTDVRIHLKPDQHP